MPNAYCDHLGIPPPSLIGLAATGKPNYLDIMVVALLERGGPVTLDEVVAAVYPLSTDTAEGIRTSLQKAWAGREPVVKDADGRFSLDLESRHLRRILVRLGLRSPPAPPQGPPAYILPAPDVPLTIEDLKACFFRGYTPQVSPIRMAAAVLDAMGHPMSAPEILDVFRGWTDERMPTPETSHYGSKVTLVVQDADGRFRLERSLTTELHAMRSKVRQLGLPRLRENANAAWYRKRAAEKQREDAARIAAMAAVPPKDKTSKIPWRGTVVSVQPRIRLTRSFDQRSHSYLGYILHVRGDLGGEAREFTVAVGKAAHEKHQFRVGDDVSGEGAQVEDSDLETANIYKVSGMRVAARGPRERSVTAPFTGVPPSLEEYRARGHRRLAAPAYAAKCGSCLWGCEMAVEMIIDQWNPSKRRYRRETFCYGPKSCPQYVAGPARKVTGRKGMSWTEEDWVDEDATGHRAEDE